MICILHDLIWTVNYGNYGIFLIMGTAGFISSTIALILGFRVHVLYTRTWNSQGPCKMAGCKVELLLEV